MRSLSDLKFGERTFVLIIVDILLGSAHNAALNDFCRVLRLAGRRRLRFCSYRNLLLTSGTLLEYLLPPFLRDWSSIGSSRDQMCFIQVVCAPSAYVSLYA